MGLYREVWLQPAVNESLGKNNGLVLVVPYSSRALLCPTNVLLAQQTDGRFLDVRRTRKKSP
jgi:hypothetical protein